MSNEKAWCKEIEDMRAAIELVNTCLGTCYSDGTHVQVQPTMKQLKKTYKALKLFINNAPEYEE